MSERILRELGEVCERHEADLHALIGQAVSEGVRTQDIAEAMGISRATLWRRYASALGHDPGHARAAPR